MRNVFNFGAGPAMLPEEVLKTAQSEFLDWHGTGMSIMELGHRGNEFKEIAEESEANLRELMNIPSNYHVLFLSGGATTQFAMVPLNLFGKTKKANYVDTGIWSKKAIDEAKRYGEVTVSAHTVKVDELFSIPRESDWSISEDTAYLHYTPNETIEGIEFHWVPKVDMPLVADMTSMILSKPIDVNDYGIIYAGAQKNISQAGLCIVIIKDELVQDPLPFVPTLYNYKIHVENTSFYNTPSTYAWYLAGLVFKWMKEKGGVEFFAEVNKRKAQKIYSTIDNSNGFYKNPVHPSARSMMNIPFNLPNDELTKLFLETAEKDNLKNLKGHRLAGGVRASIYNPMPEAGVDALVQFMKHFQQKYG